MREKMKNFWIRTWSGILLAAVVLWAILWTQWSFGVLLLLLLIVGMAEFYALAEKQGNAPQRFLGLVAGVVLFALNFAFVCDDIQILGSGSHAFGSGRRGSAGGCWSLFSSSGRTMSLPIWWG